VRLFCIISSIFWHNAWNRHSLAYTNTRRTHRQWGSIQRFLLTQYWIGFNYYTNQNFVSFTRSDKIFLVDKIPGIQTSVTEVKNEIETLRREETRRVREFFVISESYILHVQMIATYIRISNQSWYKPWFGNFANIKSFIQNTNSFITLGNKIPENKGVECANANNNIKSRFPKHGFSY